MITLFNNPFDVGFGDPVIILQNQLKSLVNTVVLDPTVFFGNNLKGVAV
jgi:hypothetical protein